MDTPRSEVQIVENRQAVTGQRENPAAYVNLGNVLKNKGELNEAIATYRQAIALDPDYREAHSALCVALMAQGKIEEAIAVCRNAIALRPDNPDNYLNLGLALYAQRNFDEAIVAFRTAIVHAHNYAAAYLSLGNALRETHRYDEAICAYGAAIASKPDYPAAHLNLANIFHEQGKIDEAIAGYSRAIALKPDFADPHSNLGNALRKQGKVDEAIAACRRAIAIQPDFPAARMNLSLALLLKGEFEEGWREYEWRWKNGTNDFIPRKFRQPRWQGEDLTGKTLLLHAEQGLGDTLQFARFAPLMAAKKAKIILAVQPPLVSLINQAGWPDVTVNNGSKLSGFDFELPLMSLPAVLNITEETIPADVPYLSADPRRVDAWRERLPKDGFKIGIVWQGRPEPRVDMGRSFQLRSCFALSRVAGVHLISLQKHHGLDQLDALPLGMRVETLGPDFDSAPDAFLDTAAVMMNLDLVITTDTASAHLAGALARPTWIALKQGPDWRWLQQREDSPWYPTARLFRQRAPGDWDEVFARMARDLAGVLAGARTALPAENGRAGEDGREKIATAGGSRDRVLVPVSFGELYDKIAIRQLELERTTDATKLENARCELDELLEACEESSTRNPALASVIGDLEQVHRTLWDIENELRDCERDGNFGPRFIELARAVHKATDLRGEIKRSINLLMESDLIEEKSDGRY